MSGGLSAAARLALLQRLSKRRDGGEGASPASRLGRDDFADLPNGRDMSMIKEAVAALGLPNPFFRVHEGRAGAETRIDGAACLNFSSYDYLGLNADPRVHEAAKAAIDQYGVSPSASRLVSGERPVHAALEEKLAAVYGAEACLSFVSGHATNVTVIGNLVGPRDLILHDAAIHNSCAEGARLSGARRVAFPHNDWQAAEKELAASRGRHGRALLVIEGHYSMDGDVPELARFVALARKHDCWLMVDEAHSLGVLGETGRGIAEMQGVDPGEVDIWMGTLSKTLAACGGYICGRRGLVEYLKYAAPGFVYSVGLAPALAASAAAALDIMLAEPERVARLRRNAQLFLRLAREKRLDTGASAGHAIVPVILGGSIAATKLSAALLDEGVNVQPIVFPAVPEKSARLRFFLGAEHTEAQVARAVDAVAMLARG